MRVGDLPTPALVVDLDAVDRNVDVMAAVRPGPMLRSHVKAHKCTALARHVAERSGSTGFCCATVREMRGMVDAGLGDDLLLANETLDADRLGDLAAGAAAAGARVTIAIDSDATLDAVRAASAQGPLAVLVDVNVGLPRCGVAPARAGALADRARRAGIEVRGVMGYEGHVVGNPDRAWRVEQVDAAMALLRAAHQDVGGDVTSAGGTGTYDLHSWASEVEAGSFLLMDTHYAQLALPFRQAAFVVSTVVSVNVDDGYAVADAGLKAFGMDHGEPTVVGHTMFFTSDEHATFVPSSPVTAGDRVTLVPAHIDPTMAKHERAWLVRGAVAGDGTVDPGAEVHGSWEIDLRGW